jgi:hypothetical protein
MAILTVIGILELTGTIDWIYDIKIGNWALINVALFVWPLGGLIALMASKERGS